MTPSSLCVGLAETIRGFQLILSGELDSLPEQAFYLIEMTLNLCVLTPNRIVYNFKLKEIILPTNSGQIDVLPSHAPIATAVDIGILRIRLNDQWLTIVLTDAFARIGNNEITQTLEKVEAILRKAEGKRQIIEVNLALRRAKTRVEATNTIW
ncbi:hypothetical protein Cgig2_009660 [Carnegiea gigantea]|uniref:ATP synthase F1 complex delta/epsilon subunit N-terminal domain-containing protein n=1 Tax=Carnegiea gigantea TaxID=171969 RepID=A0A9Q1K259_9CARY|nr:hypothetical protein Cgig2_009660 [Carnegiea gigantea]